jgi:cellulose synthase/poly-beta-1,6-N-acetylglucosamine synthase-like glycosyltransferase
MIETFLWSLISILLVFYFAYFLLNIYESKKPIKIQKEKIFPVVTLIIPTYNEEKTILRKLENATSLHYPKKKLEVLVVDSGSSDSTRKIIKNFIHKNITNFNIRFIYQKQRMGKASALNFALQQSHSEIIVISDADALLDKNAVAKLVENFADKIVGAVTGKLIIINADQSSITKLEKNYRGIFDILRLGESNLDSTPIFNGPIMAFRKNLIDKLHPETIADDTEMSMEIRKKGKKAIYTPEAIAYEYTPTKFTSRYKQKVRRGQGLVQSFIKHRDFLFNSKYGKYGRVIFPCEFFMHLGSPILLSIVSLIMLIYFVLVAVSLLIFSGLALFTQRILTKEKKITINPFSILETFLNQQFCLLVGLSLFLRKKRNYEWEKIEEIRIQSEKSSVSENKESLEKKDNKEHKELF